MSDADRGEAIRDLIEKADAGAQLFYAVYYLPSEQATALFTVASKGFLDAYGRAHAAFNARKP